jgi:hypothetical protein
MLYIFNSPIQINNLQKIRMKKKVSYIFFISPLEIYYSVVIIDKHKDTTKYLFLFDSFKNKQKYIKQFKN